MKAPSMKKIPSVKKYPKSTSIKLDDPDTYNPQPSLRLSEEVLPDIKSWILNKEYELTIKVKMIGMQTEEYGSNKGKIQGDFKITSIGLEEAE